MRLRVWTPQRTHDCYVLDQNPIRRDGWDAPARKTDYQQSTSRRDALGREIEDIAAHRIIDHIGSAAACDLLHLIYPGAVGVIQDVLGSQLFREFEFVGAARGCDHARSECPAQLDRGNSNAACASMHY